MKTGIGVFVLAVGLVAPSWACLNEYSGLPRKAEPKPIPAPGQDLFVALSKSARTDWEEQARVLKPRATAFNAAFKDESDYAVALLHLGRTKEGLKILERLAQLHPAEYTILANLGTAYELDGNLERAARYISKALELNPKSHEGTEWLHVKILEAKMAVAKDPRWLKKNSVLGQDFGGGARPVVPVAMKNNAAEIKRVSNAIVYQLRERIQFTRETDPIVADLLFDLGNIYVATGNAKTGVSLYEGSLRYSALRKSVIDSRLSQLSEKTTEGVQRKS